jgi:mutator protein MutT
LKKKNDKPHYHVTAGLIWREGKILITKRPEGSHLAGLWEFPGGKQEAGESLEQCLEREIREELGLVIKATELLLEVDHDYGTKSISLHLFRCSRLTGEPRALGCAEMRWVNPQDLDQYKLPPPDVQMIPFIRNLALTQQASDLIQT